ncbi:hypothetical protein [Winogradskyella sp.]|uniref:hypothetical protein n=1 Tax=Winogradskyella sp. TaxID=1883156 RepID=UPI00262D4623|nr:hypothetical protein [Winogradskyella sp.]
MILFMCIISAPTIIVSIDKSVDTSILFGLNEEEEKEDFKLLFELSIEDIEKFSSDYLNMNSVGYMSKKYLKPHLNLIFPPPKTKLV